MTDLRQTLLLSTVLAGCVADPVSGGDSLSGTDSGSGSGNDSEEPTVTDSSDEELTCEDAYGAELGAYTAALAVALDRMDTLEADVAAAVADMPFPTPTELDFTFAGYVEGAPAAAIDWIRCPFTSDAFEDSYTSCGQTPPPITCEGPHDCSAYCEGPLYGAGPVSCEQSCIGTCTLGVATACGGWCTGTCVGGGGAQEMFRGVCDGTCEGACELAYGECSGTCEGGCHIGLAPAGEALQCAGTCEGQASACVGSIATEEGSPCARTAVFNAAASPACEPPDIVFAVQLQASLDEQGVSEFVAFMDDLEPSMAQLFAAGHQVHMMQDALTEPPCVLDPLEASLAELTERLDALDAEIEPWLLPLTDESPPL